MAAEKLTKGRLAQILFMMTILISAFTWRSLTHSNNDVLCHLEQDCTVKIEAMEITLYWQEEAKAFRITMMPNEDELTLELLNSDAKLYANEGDWLFRIESLPARIKLSKSDQNQKIVGYINFR
ncbi:hypothetical protein [Vibrio algarum]|uniref:Uncharacterized protein n=1 Tax=Vibrio algarum TaxID=3020714 RepID=A0ABT4YQR4_9VIBR|nr:hypothetical protein [Vibrio sp. KJ40-1]MDB1123892.1 hypothetical protein [Vibrio sp. KJ40-1]